MRPRSPGLPLTGFRYPRFSRGTVAAACVALLAGSGCSASQGPGARGADSPPTQSEGTATPSPTASPTPSPTPPPAPGRAAPAPGPYATPRVAGVIASGLNAPWGLAFLPDRSALVSQRDAGTIVRVSTSGRVTRVGTVPGVRAGGEGGLLGIALSPTFARDHLLYAYLTASGDNRVVRMRYDGPGAGTSPGPRALGPAEVVLDGIDRAGIHNGGRIAFGPDGYLYVATGDAANRSSAQDRGSLNGKILRITADGRPAPGNPFPGSPVWTLGHRNVQGLAWDADGRMWASEFGQNRLDELNLIEPGRNYGWPEVEGTGGPARYTEPVATWPTDQASPSGIAVLGEAVYLAGLRGERLWQVPVPGGRAGRARDFFVGEYGRLRTVEPAPDGSLWLVTSNTDGRGDPAPSDDRILRVVLE